MATNNKLQDNLLKLLYAGVGLAAQTAEKAQTEIDTLIKKGKVSETEGKKIVDDLLKKTEAERTKLEKKFQDTVKNVADITSKELHTLVTKIQTLEKKVKGNPAPAKKTAPVKKAPKKAAKKATKSNGR